jgi:hypothetical protein
MHHKSITLILFIILIPLVSLFAQGGDGMWPAHVAFSPEKKEVMPGEVIEIILHGFFDVEGSVAGGEYFICVEASHGKILNGEPSGTGSLIAKSFRVGEGLIRVKYMAPTKSSVKQDTIIVKYEPTEDMEESTHPLKIGETKLTIIQHNIAKLRYSHYYHNTQGEAPFTLNIMVEVSLHFEALGGAGLGIPYIIKSAAVTNFSGSAKGKDVDYSLVSAKPVNYKSTLTVYLDQISGSINAVVFPRLSAMLSWEGSEGYVPPRDICLEPVTKWDKEKAEEELGKEADKLEKEMESGKAWKNMNRIMEIQKELSGVLVHPDYRVKNRWERNWVSGEANSEDSGDGWVLKKSFIWDLQKEK